MRLFVAIPLPKFARRRLADLQQSISGVRWQRQSQLHVTLKFLGEVDEQRTSLLIGGLKDIHHPALAMTIEGLGYFSRGPSPAVLWVGISNPQELHELYQRIEEQCAGLGFEPENRPFKPHITIGRMKGVSKSEVRSFIKQHKPFTIPEVDIDEFVLFESELHPDGAIHKKVEHFKLNTS